MTQHNLGVAPEASAGSLGWPGTSAPGQDLGYPLVSRGTPSPVPPGHSVAEPSAPESPTPQPGVSTSPPEQVVPDSAPLEARSVDVSVPATEWHAGLTSGVPAESGRTTEVVSAVRDEPVPEVDPDAVSDQPIPAESADANSRSQFGRLQTETVSRETGEDSRAAGVDGVGAESEPGTATEAPAGEESFVPRETERSADPEPAEAQPVAEQVVTDPTADVDSISAAPAEVKPADVQPDAVPRRAKFDEDEFGEPPVDEDPPAARTTVPRETAALPAPPDTRILVVANQKGGVGKTTTSVNLAVGLAQGGLNVLLVDLDPQGNASTALGVEHPPGTAGTYEVLIGGDDLAEHAVASPESPTLQVLPATIDLAAAEIELVSTVARESRLLKALRKYLKDHPVDYVFLDCPPSLGLLTLNALVAASEILIPIQCEYYALEGVSQLLNTIDLVKGELNDELELSTVLLTMYDGRTRLASQVADEVRTHFSTQTLPQLIPRSVRISEAPSYGQSVLTYHPDSAGAVSYREAAAEIARRGVEENS